jgi:hypothetical protein
MDHYNMLFQDTGKQANYPPKAKDIRSHWIRQVILSSLTRLYYQLYAIWAKSGEDALNMTEDDR